MAGEQHWDALCPAAAFDAGSNAWLRHGSSGEQYIKRSWQCCLTEGWSRQLVSYIGELLALEGSGARNVVGLA